MSDHEPGPASEPQPADAIDDPRGSRADLVVPVVVFVLLVVGIGRTVHRGSQTAAPSATPVTSRADGPLVVVATWSDDTDVDLSVVEPGGEACTHDHPRSAQGGVLSRDVAAGPGPETYVLPSPRSGDYRVVVRCDPGKPRPQGASTTVTVTVYRPTGQSARTLQRAATLVGHDPHQVVTVEVE